MIETLNGDQETVHFRNTSLLVLYDNHEFETYPLHWHTPIEIILPLQNGYPVTCQGISYNLHEGDVLIILPHVQHYIPAAHGRRYILQASLLPIFSSMMSPMFYPLLPPAIMLTAQNDQQLHKKVKDLIHSIYHEYHHFTRTSELSMYISLQQILLLVSNAVLRNVPDEERGKPSQRLCFDVLLEIFDYINQNFAESITLDEIAERSGFSKYYLSRQFKVLAGESFYQYLSRIRIHNADMQLANPNILITDIACNSGFLTSSAFIRMFKKFHGCTPSEFRNMYAHCNAKETRIASKQPADQHEYMKASASSTLI